MIARKVMRLRFVFSILVVYLSWIIICWYIIKLLLENITFNNYKNIDILFNIFNSIMHLS